MTLYDAVKLASKQPPNQSADNARLGPQYYMFGAPGSAACAALAKAQGKTPSPGVHCLLSGPDDNQQDLLSGLPNGVSASEGQQLVVPPGTVVLQAADPNANKQTNPNDPNAQFYVLKDHVSLFGNEITNPQQSTDQGGSPDVTFSFNSKGNKAFEDVTSTIAHRGDLVSGLGQTLNQHFAVALDNKLVTVPQIDFKTYPDGIQGGGGADITGGFTIQSAQDLATQLRLGALPINLKLISESQVSATLGKQALHQGLIAGLVGPPDRDRVPVGVLPRAGRDRDRRPDRLRDLLLRADQADPDHADVARHRRSDPDDRRCGRREHRDLRTRQGGDPGRTLDPAGDRRRATARA